MPLTSCKGRNTVSFWFLTVLTIPASTLYRIKEVEKVLELCFGWGYTAQQFMMFIFFSSAWNLRERFP